MAAPSWILPSLAMGIHTVKTGEGRGRSFFPLLDLPHFRVSWDYYPQRQAERDGRCSVLEITGHPLRCWNNGYYLRLMGWFEPRSQWARGVDYFT